MIGCPAEWRSWRGLILMVAILAASAIKVDIAPAAEFYVGPLFYLLAYHYRGTRAGLMAAAAVMLPSIWWWDHPWSVVLAMAHVLFLAMTGRQDQQVTARTLIFNLTIGSAIGWLATNRSYGGEATFFLVGLLRRLANDGLLAILADTIFVVMALPRGRLLPRVRRVQSIIKLMTGASALAVHCIMTIQFVAGLHRIPADIGSAIVQIGRNEAHQLRAAPSHPGIRIVRTTTPAGTPIAVALVPDTADLSGAVSALGCSQLYDLAGFRAERHGFTLGRWSRDCQLLAVPQLRARLVVPYRPVAAEAYREAVVSTLWWLLMLPILLALRWFLVVALRRTESAWRELADSLGKPGLHVPHFMVEELRAPVAGIAEANNRFVAMAEERSRLERGFRTLGESLGLRVVADIAYDADSGRLSFVDPRPGQHERGFMLVAPEDRTALANLASQPRLQLEIRLGDGDRTDWHLLLLERGDHGTHRWQSGYIVPLLQPRAVHDAMLKQARMVELGGMASALGHELRQPLSTIAMAAGNGRFLLQRPDGAERAGDKFDRIMHQVERASEIISRIAGYSRADLGDAARFDAVEAVELATSFLNTQLAEAGIRLVIDRRPGEALPVCMPRVAFEQVVVNLTRNAIDAIRSGRAARGSAPGELRICCTRGPRDLELQFIDNGSGLPADLEPEALFTAFTTTKGQDGTGLGLYISRNIVTEHGGRLDLSARTDGQSGAVVVMRLPLATDAPREPA